MLRLSGSLVSPRLPVSTRLLWERQARHVHDKGPRNRKVGPTRRTFPDFTFPDLLLDLDAEGTKGVREFNDQVDGVPEPARSERDRKLQDVKRQVDDKFEKIRREYESRRRSVTDSAFNPLQITDFDVLTASFLIPHSAVKSAEYSALDRQDTISYAKTLGTVIDGNGIPHTVRDDPSKTTTYMLRRQAFTRVQPGRRKHRTLKLALSKCQSFSEIERVLTKAAKTIRGYLWLSFLGNMIHTAFTRVKDAKPTQVLSLLNNLVMNLENNNYYMSANIYELGIWTSLECHAFVTTEQYLRRLKHVKHQLNDRFTESLLAKILQTSIASSQAITSAVGLNPAIRLTSIFSLLTGYIPGEHTAPISVRSLVSRAKPTCFRLYIRCLARLGAFRAIWHEWHNTNSDVQGVGVDTGEWSPEEKDNMAQEILDVLAANDRIRDLARAPEFLYLEERYLANCHLDIVTISNFAETLALPEKQTGDHDVETNAEERAQLHRCLSKEDIRDAMRDLQIFLTQKDSS